MAWYGAAANKGDLSPWYGGEFPPDVGGEAKVVAGAVAGNVTVAGVRANDDLIAVFYHDPVTPALSDLTSEFSITADDTINNGGGTDTSAGTLMVIFAARNVPVA